MSTSNTETELKAGIAPGDIETVRTRLSELAEPVSKSLTSVYYDTADRRLQRKAIALRLRTGGDTVTQTLKCDRQANGGLHRVREVDAVLDGGSEPEIAAIPDEALRCDMTALVGRARLRPVFETRVERLKAIIAVQAGTVEVAIDTGVFVAGGREAGISEVEFEVTRGEAAAAYQAAAAILGPVPAHLLTSSKADRGYALANGDTGADAAPTAVRTGTPPPLTTDWTLDTLAAFLAAYASALADNLHCVFASNDPEGPHQMRVTLRRLRALLWLGRPVMAPGWYKRQARTFKALGRAVAPARDADVFIDEIVRPAMGEAASEADTALLARLEGWRAETYADVHKALRAMQATGSVFRLLESVTTRGWSQRSAGLVAAFSELAGPALDKEWSRLDKAGRKLAKLAVDDRHTLRKDLKRFRYGAELAAATLPAGDPAAAAFLSRLKSVQTTLGRLNDLDTIAPLRPDLGDGDLNARLEALLVVTEAGGDKPAAKRRRRWMEKARDQWRKLQDTPAFWPAKPA